MSGASASTDPTTTKAITDDSSKTPSAAQEGQNKKGPTLEEDDEFEDFPVDGAFLISLHLDNVVSI